MGTIMRQSVTRDLYAYWNVLRKERAAPERSDIDPAAIRHVLADTFILEIDSNLEFTIRLSGTRIDAIWLGQQKGRSFLELWSERDRNCIAAAILTVIDGVTPIIAGARAKAPSEPPVDLELLLLPLRHFGKTHSRLIGSLVPAFEANWVGLTQSEPLELTSLRVIGAAPLGEANSASAWQVPIHSPPRLVVHEGGKS
jgi:hypothetical protein